MWSALVFIGASFILVEIFLFLHGVKPSWFPRGDPLGIFFVLNRDGALALLSSSSFVGGCMTGGLSVLFGSLLINYLGLSWLGLYGTFGLGFIALLSTFILFLGAFAGVMGQGVVSHFILFKWFALNHGLVVSFSLYIDTISYSFALLTTSIALFVYVYAFAYFRYEPNVDRLLVFLNSFVASMLLLVLSGNLVMLFLG
jgi:hypothetical protein